MYTRLLMMCAGIAIAGNAWSVTPQQEHEQSRLFHSVLHHNVAYIRSYIHAWPHVPNPAIDNQPRLCGLIEVPNNTILHVAAEIGAEDIVTLLVSYNIDVNVRNANGKTPMHKAVAHGQYHIVRRLIEAGAHAHVRDTDGHTPFTRAWAYATNPDLTMRKRIDPQCVWSAMAIIIGLPLERCYRNVRNQHERTQARELVNATIAYMYNMYYTI